MRGAFHAPWQSWLRQDCSHRGGLHPSSPGYLFRGSLTIFDSQEPGVSRWLGLCVIYVDYTYSARTSKPERQVQMMFKTSVELIPERMFVFGQHSRIGLQARTPCGNSFRLLTHGGVRYAGPVTLLYTSCQISWLSSTPP